MEPADMGSEWKFLDAAPAAVLITDADLDRPGPTIVYANPAFERLSGWAPRDIQGRTPRVLQGPETDLDLFPEMRSALAAGHTWYGQTINYRYDGTAFTMRWSISPVSRCNGAITHYMAVQEDVTQLEEHADALQKTAARLRNAQHIGRMGGWSYDLSTNILVADDEAVELLNLYQLGHRFSLQTFFELIHPDDADRVRAAVQDALATGNDYACEYRILVADGVMRVVYAAAEVAVDGSGSVIGMTGVVQDITQRYRVREELEAARNAAVASSEAKSRFLAMTGHELRTPLNAINGFAELLTRELMGPHSVPEYKEYAAHILESGEHLSGVIESILDVARLESGRLAIDESVFPVSDLLGTLNRWLTTRAGERDVALTFAAVPEVHLRADRRLLRQVLVNLGENAVKFSPAGAQVRIETRLSGDGSLQVAVTDEGPGIAPENIDRIKHAFVQIDSRLERSYEGLGLGLYLVQAFLDAHDASLELISEPGKGTTATAILPPDRVSRSVVPQFPMQGDPSYTEDINATATATATANQDALQSSGCQNIPGN